MKIILNIEPQDVDTLDGLKAGDEVTINANTFATIDGFKRDGRTSSRLVSNAEDAE